MVLGGHSVGEHGTMAQLATGILGSEWLVNERALLTLKPDVSIELAQTHLEEARRTKSRHKPQSSIDRGSLARSVSIVQSQKDVVWNVTGREMPGFLCCGWDRVRKHFVSWTGLPGSSLVGSP